MTALDKEKTLSETFIRELNKTILVRDFWKTSKGGDFRYQISEGYIKRVVGDRGGYWKIS